MKYSVLPKTFYSKVKIDYGEMSNLYKSAEQNSSSYCIIYKYLDVIYLGMTNMFFFDGWMCRFA